ncbi:MAG: phosphoribosylglycinamide formyltransferase [Marinilabiliales bacterium]|nr:MAG: phosphoribosylglycinamide formyltransferase [Marinilabiliales bacterium]
MINLAVFASGSGTNFQAITDYFAGHDRIGVKLLLCNRPDARALHRAREAGVDSFVFTPDELYHGDAVLKALRRHNIDFIVLAGFLLKIPGNILAAFPERIVNIHPALLPKYGGKGMYGMRVHKAVIEAGDKFSGITVHMVNEDYDSGSIVSQHTCEVRQDDTPESLAERVHKLEHHWYPRIIGRLLDEDS